MSHITSDMSTGFFQDFVLKINLPEWLSKQNLINLKILIPLDCTNFICSIKWLRLLSSINNYNNKL